MIEEWINLRGKKVILFFDDERHISRKSGIFEGSTGSHIFIQGIRGMEGLLLANVLRLEIMEG
ncbi:MAG: hypothetical protein ABH863_03175 [Candidatus Micrarchaeota archaeon]